MYTRSCPLSSTAECMVQFVLLLTVIFLFIVIVHFGNSCSSPTVILSVSSFFCRCFGGFFVLLFFFAAGDYCMIHVLYVQNVCNFVRTFGWKHGDESFSSMAGTQRHHLCSCDLAKSFWKRSQGGIGVQQEEQDNIYYFIIQKTKRNK